MVKSKEVAYYAKHEEADIRMMHHVGQRTNGTKVVVRTVNTDVVVIALGCLHQLQDKRICMASGVLSKNNLRYISINQLFHQLREPLCKSLPFCHVFTEWDYTSSFNRKGQIKPFKLLEKILNFKKHFWICYALKVYPITSNQSLSPLRIKCIEKQTQSKRQTQSIKHV